MRAAFSLLIVIAICAAMCPSPACAQDKEEKEQREKLEKQLAELEPALEKQEWAIKRKQTIADLVKHLDKAERIDLYRLNPRSTEHDVEKKRFHGHDIISEVPLTTKGQRNESANYLGKKFHWNDGRIALCFNPRHGLRAVLGERTVDFVICFQCTRAEVYENGKLVLGALPLTFNDEKNPIEQVLAGGEKKSKEQK